MKKILLIVILSIGCEDKNKQSEFDNTLPTLDIDKYRIVEEGGGFGMVATYSLSFSGYIINPCLLYTSPSPRDVEESRMPSSA